MGVPFYNHTGKSFYRKRSLILVQFVFEAGLTELILACVVTDFTLSSTFAPAVTVSAAATEPIKEATTIKATILPRVRMVWPLRA